MLSPTYEITTALSHTDELISPPYDIAIVTFSYGRVTKSSVWDSMMSKKIWCGPSTPPYLAAVIICFVWQADLDETASVWNSHRIRRTRQGIQAGRPNLLYHWPWLYGTQDYLYKVREEDVMECKRSCLFRKAIPCNDGDVYELLIILLRENGAQFPRDAYDGVHLYKTLRNLLNQLVTWGEVPRYKCVRCEDT